jgi:hypothetical protein
VVSSLDDPVDPSESVESVVSTEPTVDPASRAGVAGPDGRWTITEPGADPGSGVEIALSWTPYCGRCGDSLAGTEHPHCDAALELEPPRYCTQCRRRLVVQVLPTGWSARCSEHGDLRAGTAPSSPSPTGG